MNNVKLKDINGNDVEYTGVNVFIRDENNNFNKFTRPQGTLDIIENNVNNLDVLNYAKVNVATQKPLTISTEEKMEELIKNATSGGMIVQYTGHSGTYKQYATYKVLIADEKLGTYGFYELVTPVGTLDISNNGIYDVMETAKVNVNVKGGTNGLPVEVSTQEEIDALAIGTIFKYTGESGTYENGALYLVESTELTFTILGEKLIEYKALKGMTWAEFVDSSYNDGRVYIGKYQPTPGNYTPDDRVLYRNRLEDEKDGFYALYNPAVDDYTQKPDTLIVDGAEYLSATG